jgi:hypothetical protein
MGATQKRIADPVKSRLAPKVFAVVAGFFFFVAIIKFGTPVILANAVQPPENARAAVFESWEVKWGYWLMLPLIAAGLVAVGWRTLSFRWPLVLPLAWLGWQFIAATQSVSPSLTTLTLQHFSACVIFFYLGAFALKGVRNPWPVWTGLALALCWIMRSGLEQHFGGLEATRRFLASAKDNLALPSSILNNPDYQKRIASNRIFSTFSNPDAFAGAILLFLPLTLVFLWQITPKVRIGIRWAFVAILGGCGLACLYWSGSKGGWLVTLVVAIIALGHSTLSLKWKRILIYGVLILGIVGFGVRNAAFFHKQKNSVGARFAYWKVGLRIVAKDPLLGTGPGTFSVPYGQLKRPDDEMARLCHNDYLEQACDSGIPGFAIYAGMIAGYLLWLYRYRAKAIQGYSSYFMAWLGMMGLCLHSLVEYHLYIPSLAWPMFFLLGWAMNFED